MRELWQFERGELVFEAAVYYDDGDNPLVHERPSDYKRSQKAAEAFARQALRGRAADGPDSGTPRSAAGQVVDSIVAGHPQDREFEPEPDWPPRPRAARVTSTRRPTFRAR